MSKPTEGPDQPSADEDPQNVVQMPQSDATVKKPRRLLAPPPKPDRTFLPRLSMTVAEVLDLTQLVLEDTVDAAVTLYWHDVGELIHLEQPDDLKNVANPRDVGAFAVAVQYGDGTALELQLSFGRRRGLIDVHGIGQARERGRAIQHRFESLRRTPQWLLKTRSAIFKPGALMAWMTLLLLGTWATLVGVLALTGQGQTLRESFSGGWQSWAIPLPFVALFFLAIELIDRRPRFQLRADQIKNPPNWEVRWGAAGAIVGVLGVIVALVR